MQRRRIESSRNKETTLKKTWVEIAIKKHTHKTKNTRVQPKKQKKKNETAIDSSRHRQLGEPAALRQTNLLKEEQKKSGNKEKQKKTKQERTREIMNYYVVGKLKYIIEEIVLLRFRGQNKTDAKKEDQIKEETTVTQYTNKDTHRNRGSRQ